MIKGKKKKISVIVIKLNYPEKNINGAIAKLTNDNLQLPKKAKIIPVAKAAKQYSVYPKIVVVL